MPRTRDTRQPVEEVVDGMHGVASQVHVNVNEAAQNAQKTISDAAATMQNAPDAAQNGVQNAMSTVQSYVHEGQRFASEHKAQLQEAVKKAVNAAHGYVEDARKKADPYVESAKAKVDSARASVENARHSAQNAVDNAKEQVTAVRTKVTVKTQPYVSNYQEFDVTKTAAFHVLTHVISGLLYIVWRLTQLIPSAQHMITVIQKKEADAAVAQNCATVMQKVPVVGPRAVEVATIAFNNVCTDLNEQISQYATATQRPKTA
ncbi:conserved hypothetical protein [Leishmania major strain Friedlin]|uniref:Uncharacterized protein n=1 Tax=Leishmania major TaxID=5664 RepID=Q4QBX7_LEIMA|nr:conserved hypothetical protein [Leishmania major strain Friedlin]CAG9573886.1 hypothetical_protein_-_conserved [Leishmania major strain Friedlin]CAJ03861.1 conserved hypothetical protein [Leishmania major strain Friedlin]|eukprot:XP_001683171.1 conserved hypothetical protein [Leishmania major strain Friedlin]